MQNPKNTRPTSSRKNLSDSEAGRNAAIDWEWFYHFTKDLQYLMDGVDWKCNHFLGKAVTLHQARNEHEAQCMNIAFAKTSTILMYLKDNEQLLLEANKIAQEQTFIFLEANHKKSKLDARKS